MKKPVAIMFLFILGALALIIGRAQANAGDLDPTWGDGGVVRVTFSESDHIMTTGQLDPDGRVVIVGWVDGYPGAFGIARLRADGSLDPSFGTDGGVTTRFSADPELPNSPWSVSSRPGGGYLVAGEICDVDYVVCEWVSAAYTAGGTLDLAFGGGDGWITTTVAGADGVYAWPPRNITQSNGKTIVGGIVVQPDGDIDMAVRRHNLDGSLDAAYGAGGIAVYDFNGLGNYIEDMNLLPDGKLLIAGGFGEVIDPFNYTPDSAFLMRLNPDGSIDDTFGDGGLVTWDGDGEGATSEGLAVTSEGDIFVAGGLAESKEVITDCAVWRFDAAGDMDMSFGDGGQLVIDTGLDDVCLSLDLMADGRLALSGQVLPPEAEREAGGRAYSRGAAGRSAQAGETIDTLVARAFPGGTLDTSFGDGGVVVQDIDESDNAGYIVLAQPDGRTLVLGDVPEEGSEVLGFAVSRFQGDALATAGQLDPTWGDEGTTVDDITDDEDWGNAHALMDDGKYVVAGWAGYPGDYAVARYLPDGRLDPSFGDGGKVITAFSDDPTLVDAAWAAAARPDGGLYVAGDTCDADYIMCELGVAAYRADGSLDTDFSDDGLATVSSALGPVYAWPGRAVVQPDGKLVVGGAIFLDTDVDLIMARFHPDGTPDDTFGDSGVAITDLGETENFMQDLMALPNGKFLAVGVFGAAIDPLSTEQDAGFIARFNADGSLDMAFGGGDGYASWDNGGQGALGQHGLLAPDGKLLVMGRQARADGADCTLQRFDMNGNPDTTFGDGGKVILASGLNVRCLEMDFDGAGRIAFVAQELPPEEEPATVGATSASDRLWRRAASRADDPANRQNELPRNIVGRVMADGTPDATFGENGLLYPSIAGGAGLIFNLTVQPDGKILVSGDTLYEFVTARILGDGPAAQVFMPILSR